MPLQSIKFQKQPLMRNVLRVLGPIFIASVYFFGWRSLALTATSVLSGLFTEWWFKRKNKKPISEAVFVSGALFALTLPPSTPLWIAALGMIFGILFAKEVFGGFGRNVYNPALVARAFVYVCFPTYLTIKWNTVYQTFPGGFVSWLSPHIDTLTTATPMLAFRNTHLTEPLINLFFGNVSGSLGETSALLIIIAAVYLIWSKTAAWETMAGTLLGLVGFNTVMYWMGFTQVPPPAFGLLSGGILFGAVFMATDPISSPKTLEGKWIYGLLIGIVTVIIRGFALFAGGMMFAILIANTFVPIIDVGVKGYKNHRKTTRLQKEVTHEQV